MNWTNSANLPQPLVSAIANDQYDKVGDISVTSLILPPRIRVLMKRHADEITEDVSEGIWRLVGSIGHKILERSNTYNHLAEERLTAYMLGWLVSGKADLLGPEMTLDDYKFISVWSLLDEKPEWEMQLNLYAWLYQANGFDVKQLRIIAILRDWAKSRAMREPDYPQVGVVVREIKLWSETEQNAVVWMRVKLHKEAEELSDDELPICTDEERWKQPDKWAVKKKVNKKAFRLFSSEKAANNFVIEEQLQEHKIEHRPGSYPRCANYCAVWAWCSEGRKIHAQSESDDRPF